MTIKDIAKLCGVSVSTVSRVLNNHPDVSEENRQQVLAVIKQYNYIPNNSARNLVKTTSDSIGLIVRGLNNPFYTDIIHAIEKRVHARGYTMVMQHITSEEDELKFGAMMERDKRLQGILFLGGRSDYAPKDTALLNVPFVCCTYSNQYGTLESGAYASVSIADDAAAYEAVKTLYEAGHRRIAVLISESDDLSISQLRYEGYKTALADFDLPADDALVIRTGSYGIHDAYRATEQALQRGCNFSAVFAISDMMAIGAMRAIREAGRQVPEDCSVIAIDGLQLSDYIYPRLATFCQPMEQIGQRSVDILLDLIEGKGNNRQEILPVTFRQGESVKKI